MSRRAFMRELVRFQDKRETSAGKHALGSATHTSDTLANLNTKVSDADLQAKHLELNEQTGASYTLVLADDGKQIDMNRATAQTLTVPPNSSVAFPTGAQILVRQKGAGQVTIAAGVGVTLQAEGSVFTTVAQHAVVALVKLATDTWVMIGSAPMRIAINETASASYTLALTDDSKLIDLNSTGAQTLTIPANASVAFETGTQLLFRQKGSGAVTVAASSGVTLQGADSAVQTRVQHSVGGLIKVATNTWLIFGDLTT